MWEEALQLSQTPIAQTKMELLMLLATRILSPKPFVTTSSKVEQMEEVLEAHTCRKSYRPVPRFQH
jgi:hypothetical protein